MAPMTNRRSPRPTRLEDVADAARVHVPTASRVLNGWVPAPVRPETRERVQRAAASLQVPAQRHGPGAQAGDHRRAGTAGSVAAKPGVLGDHPRRVRPGLGARVRGADGRRHRRVERPAGVQAAGRRGPHRRPVDRQRPARGRCSTTCPRSRSRPCSSTAATSAAAATR